MSRWILLALTGISGCGGSVVTAFLAKFLLYLLHKILLLCLRLTVTSCLAVPKLWLKLCRHNKLEGLHHTPGHSISRVL